MALENTQHLTQTLPPLLKEFPKGIFHKPQFTGVKKPEIHSSRQQHLKVMILHRRQLQCQAGGCSWKTTSDLGVVDQLKLSRMSLAIIALLPLLLCKAGTIMPMKYNPAEAWDLS